MLRAGVEVSWRLVASLERVGVLAVWIDDDLSVGIEPLESLTEQTREQAVETIHTVFTEVSGTTGGGALTDAAVDRVLGVARRIAVDIVGNADCAVAINELATADSYTMKHSLSVTALGLALGARLMYKYGWIDYRGKRQYDDIDERLVMLGVGLMLHDIGKLAVPHDVLHKNGPLTPDEQRIMRAHPELGVEMLKGKGVSPLARAVVRSHHEKWDGTGYPDGKAGHDIHQFARVAAAADVFDALTSERSYRTASPAHVGYDYVLTRKGSEFDPEVVDVFKTSIAPYPPGTGVILSDGYRGIVKDVRQGFVTRPVVRVVFDPTGAEIEPKEIDLTEHSTLTIVSADLDPWTRPEVAA